jgi:hypothetical protein
MGYAAVIDATFSVCINLQFMRRAPAEYARTGDYTGMTHAEFVAASKAVEDTIGLEDYYRIEAATVEKPSRRRSKR